MNPTDIIGLAGFVLGLPSAFVAIGDLQTRRTNQRDNLVVNPLAQLNPIGRPLSRPRRILSMFIDTYAVTLTAVFFSGALVPPDAPTEDFDTAVSILFFILTAGIAAWNASTGRSPGKHLVGGRVVGHSDHAPITFSRAFLRIVCHAIPFGFWMVLGGDRRSAADHITGTSVISTR